MCMTVVAFLLLGRDGEPPQSVHLVCSKQVVDAAMSEPNVPQGFFVGPWVQRGWCCCCSLSRCMLGITLSEYDEGSM